MRWRLNSPASRLFTQPFIQTRHWPLCGEFIGDRWIPRTNAQETRKMFPFDDIIIRLMGSTTTRHIVFVPSMIVSTKAPFQYKDRIFIYADPIIKIRLSWDRIIYWMAMLICWYWQGDIQNRKNAAVVCLQISWTIPTYLISMIRILRHYRIIVCKIVSSKVFIKSSSNICIRCCGTELEKLVSWHLCFCDVS